MSVLVFAIRRVLTCIRNRAHRLFKRGGASGRVKFCFLRSRVHEVPKGVRGNHNAAWRAVIMPPAAVALGTENIRKRGELQYRIIWPTQEDVLSLGVISVVRDAHLHVEFDEST